MIPAIGRIRIRAVVPILPARRANFAAETTVRCGNLPRLVRDRQVDFLGGGKFSRSIEHARARMHLKCRLQQQILQCRMQILRTARLAFDAIRSISCGGRSRGRGPPRLSARISLLQVGSMAT